MGDAAGSPRFPIFALTGGVGSGKSTVARALRERGYPIVDADEIARALTTPGSEAVRALESAFGSAILKPGDELDRRALAALVFADSNARERLNAILHPRIAEAAAREFRAHHDAGRSLVGYEVPLLFETNQHSRYEPIVVVRAPPEVQIERAMRRSGWTREETEARVAAQLDLATKAAQAHFVVDNSGSEEGLAREIDRLVEFLETHRRN